MKPIHRLGLVVLTGCLAGLLADQIPHSEALAGITKGEPSCPGDTNNDFVVNGADLSVLLGNFGAVCPGPPCAGDLNGDNLVNGADLAVLLATFGNSCVECTFSTDCPPRPNATMACLNAQCVIASCTPGFANCDGDILNGCETPLNTLQNCGGCGVSCVLPNASSSCVSGSCSIVSCNLGFSNCDGNIANGCELNHNQSLNSCAGAEFLGTHCGDLDCGLFCPNAARGIVATRTGNRERWFRVRNLECASCSSPIRHVVRLSVPGTIDYDLYVYSSCGGALIGTSTAGTGVAEVVTVQRSDSAAGDDSFDYWIEIRHFSGSTCNNWSLTVEASPGC